MGRVGRSTLVLGAGLGVTGLGTLVTMSIAARCLPSREYGAFVTWWAFATFCGAIFSVFETYIARDVVTAVSDGNGFRIQVATLSGAALVVACGISGSILISSAWLARHLFNGNIASVVLLPLFVGVAMLQCLQRGVGTGRRTFSGNASQAITDGILRALFAGAVALAGRHSMNWYAAATCASAACSLIVAHAVAPVWVHPRFRDIRRHWMPLLQISSGTVTVMLLLNGSIVWLGNYHGVSMYTLGAFAGAITLSQVPAQFASAAASPALSNLSMAIDQHRIDEFLSLRKKMLGWCTFVGALFTVVFALIGQWALTIYLGRNYFLSRPELIILATSSSAILLAQVEQAALSAKRKWRYIPASWGLGSLSFLSTLFLPIEPLTRALLAPLAGSVVVFMVFTSIETLEHRKQYKEFLT